MCSSSVSVPSVPAISSRLQADDVHSVTAQVEEPCTYTATSCLKIGGPTETITVYEEPFTATATSTYDCAGCSIVTVETKNCFGVGPVSPYSLDTSDIADQYVPRRRSFPLPSILSLHRLPPLCLFAAQLLTDRI